MPTNALTTHRAASLERQAWIAKLKRELKAAHQDLWEESNLKMLNSLIKWGEARVRRFEKKKGGLGK